MDKREGTKFITEFPKNKDGISEKCVSMCTFDNTVFVATTFSVYELVGKEFRPIPFVKDVEVEK